MPAELTERNARQRMDEAVSRLAEEPLAGDGRGIVICAGGLLYFVNAWVCINMLRRLQCNLPIEVWHMGPSEMNQTMRDLLEPLRVTCVDAFEVLFSHPVRVLQGWELKPFSIIHSQFDEVLLLDADNVPALNPEFLFETPQFHQAGAIFWPDSRNLRPEQPIWKFTGVPFRDEPTFESGQLVLSKRRCSKPLSLTMWMNEHSDFWFRHIYGDKDTFHLAWRRLGQSYAMPPRGRQPMSRIFCQYDFEGRRLFQHRSRSKWRLGHFEANPEFHFARDCREFLLALEQYRDALRD